MNPSPNQSIIDRDIEFYTASWEAEDRLVRSMPDDAARAECKAASQEALVALRQYRDALKAAGRLL